MKDHDDGQRGLLAAWDGLVYEVRPEDFKQTEFVGHRYRTPAGGNVATPGDDCDPPLIVEEKP